MPLPNVRGHRCRVKGKVVDLPCVAGEISLSNGRSIPCLIACFSMACGNTIFFRDVSRQHQPIAVVYEIYLRTGEFPATRPFPRH